jgi:SAM-dependent methyltransferase
MEAPKQMIPCPACSSERSRTEFSVLAQEAAQHFVLRQGNPQRHDALARHIELLWGGKSCEIRTCKDCQFGFANPYVAGDSTFYNLAYERASYPVEKWEFSRTLEDLRAIRFVGQRVLEAGAGQGFFLDKIVESLVPRGGITALEYSDKALLTLRSKGYNALKTDIREVDILPGFDAIFLFQVVEHMDNLANLFRRLAELLRFLGVAYIAVPNSARLKFNERNRSLLDMPPNHIGRWSLSAFDHLATANGLQVAASELEPFSASEFAKQDLGYAYLRQAQQAGTLANWSRARRSSLGGKAVGTAVGVAGVLGRLPVWVKAMKTGDLGESLWVKLVRVAE